MYVDRRLRAIAKSETDFILVTYDRVHRHVFRVVVAGFISYGIYVQYLREADKTRSQYLRDTDKARSAHAE